MIGEAQAERAEAEAIQEPAKTDMPLFVRVPLRQNDHCALPAARGAIREEACVDRVVLLMWRVDRARERQVRAPKGVAIARLE